MLPNSPIRAEKDLRSLMQASGHFISCFNMLNQNFNHQSYMSKCIKEALASKEELEIQSRVESLSPNIKSSLEVQIADWNNKIRLFETLSSSYREIINSSDVLFHDSAQALNLVHEQLKLPGQQVHESEMDLTDLYNEVKDTLDLHDDLFYIFPRDLNEYQKDLKILKDCMEIEFDFEMKKLQKESYEDLIGNILHLQRDIDNKWQEYIREFNQLCNKVQTIFTRQVARYQNSN